MPISITEKADGAVLEIQLSGKLIRDDFLKFGPEIDGYIKSRGKVSVLVLMEDFHGWDLGAFWEEIKWDFKHYSHIERLALVGDERWEARMATMCRPFMSGEVRYFRTADLEQAREWIEHAGKAMA